MQLHTVSTFENCLEEAKKQCAEVKYCTLTRGSIKRTIQKCAENFSTGLAASQRQVAVFDEAGRAIFLPESKSFLAKDIRIPWSVRRQAKFILALEKFICVAGSKCTATVYQVI